MSRQEQVRIIERLANVIAHYRGCALVQPEGGAGCTCGQASTAAVARADALRLLRYLRTPQ